MPVVCSHLQSIFLGHERRIVGIHLRGWTSLMGSTISEFAAAASGAGVHQEEHQTKPRLRTHETRTPVPLLKEPLLCVDCDDRESHKRVYAEMAASVFAAEVRQSDSVPINALMASTFSGITSDSDEWLGSNRGCFRQV